MAGGPGALRHAADSSTKGDRNVHRKRIVPPTAGGNGFYRCFCPICNFRSCASRRDQGRRQAVRRRLAGRPGHRTHHHPSHHPVQLPRLQNVLRRTGSEHLRQRRTRLRLLRQQNRLLLRRRSQKPHRTRRLALLRLSQRHFVQLHRRHAPRQRPPVRHLELAGLHRRRTERHGYDINQFRSDYQSYGWNATPTSWSGFGDIRIANLLSHDANGGQAQDQLVAVPEPASALLLGIPASLYFCSRRRRSKPTPQA